MKRPVVTGIARSFIFSLLVSLIALMAASCTTQDSQPLAQNSELIVFAAASLSEVFTELSHQFESNHPGTKVILNLAGSQQLAHQLNQGAPADLFASANERQMEVAISSGRIDPSSRRIFAQNRLVVVVPRNNPGDLKTFEDLAIPGKRLIIAAPEVPAGTYAQMVIKNISNDPRYGGGFYQAVFDNIVSYEENVRAVLSKIRLGEGDGGIVYLSDVMNQAAEEVNTLSIPDEFNILAKYPIALTNDSKQPELALEFIDFLLSRDGQQVLAEFGFTQVKKIE